MVDVEVHAFVRNRFAAGLGGHIQRIGATDERQIARDYNFVARVAKLACKVPEEFAVPFLNRPLAPHGSRVGRYQHRTVGVSGQKSNYVASIKCPDGVLLELADCHLVGFDVPFQSAGGLGHDEEEYEKTE